MLAVLRHKLPMSLRIGARKTRLGIREVRRQFEMRCRNAFASTGEFLANVITYYRRYSAGYNESYFLVGENEERRSYQLKIIRPGDMGAAMCYALGIDSYDDVVSLFEIPKNENHYLPNNTDCNKQVMLLKRHQKRIPKLVIDVGCGRGELAAAFSYCGIKCIGIDPTTGSAALVGKTAQSYFDKPVTFEFLNKSALSGIKHISKNGYKPDTIIFCESIEHINRREFLQSFEIIKKLLSETNGRLIVVNWIDFHPIEREQQFGWDHIQRIDDELYDFLGSQAKRIVFRRGSHLVLEF